MQEQDIIAEVIVYTSALLIALLGIEIFVQYLLLRKQILLELIGNKNAVSGVMGSEELELIVQNAKILPLLELRIEPYWENSRMPVGTFLFSGLSKAKRSISVPIIFPHRGVWSCNKVNYKFNDHFGFFKVQGQIQLKERFACKVEPANNSYSDLPIISSMQREGTDFPTQGNPQGDALELKSYHPSDGLKKIAWKIYARSSELLSRHPEPSMSPEGRIAVLCLAGTQQDAAARLCLNYLKKAESRELLIVASCLGNSSRDLSDSTESFKELLIETAWNANYSQQTLLNALASHLEIHKKNSYSNLLIFISEGETQLKEYLKLLEELNNILKTNSIEPIFLVAKDDLELTQKIVIKDNDFYQQCITNNWQIYKEE